MEGWPARCPGRKKEKAYTKRDNPFSVKQGRQVGVSVTNDAEFGKA